MMSRYLALPILSMALAITAILIGHCGRSGGHGLRASDGWLCHDDASIGNDYVLRVCTQMTRMPR